MTMFRIFLVILLANIVIYTVPVVANHGLNLLPIFFGDIVKMEWPGQFNLDFFGFLIFVRHFGPLGATVSRGVALVWLFWRCFSGHHS